MPLPKLTKAQWIAIAKILIMALVQIAEPGGARLRIAAWPFTGCGSGSPSSTASLQ